MEENQKEIAKLIQEKEKLIAMIGKEELSNESLLGQFELLKTERDELKKNLIIETNEATAAEKNVRKLKKDLKKLKLNYEVLVWERVEVEREVTKLESNIELIKKKISEAEAARKTTDNLRNKLEIIKLEVQKKIEERKEVDEEKKKLENELQILKNKLIKQFSKSNEINSELTNEKTIIQRKLRIRTSIDDLLCELNSEVETLKEQVNREEKSRQQLNFILSIEVNELNRRIEVEKKTAELIKNRLNEGMKSHSDLHSETSSVEEKLINLIENNSLSSTSFFKDHRKDLVDVLSLLNNINQKISEINNFQFNNARSHESIDENSIETINNFDIQLNDEENLTANLNLVEKNIQLEKVIFSLQSKIYLEQLILTGLEKKFSNEILDLKKMISVSNSPSPSSDLLLDQQ